MSALPAPPRLAPLHKALLVSAALHALLLGLRLQPTQQQRSGWHDSGLRIVLVNRAGHQAPLHPQVLAQHDLDAGGSDSGLATSPLPAADSTQPGNSSVDLEQQLRRQQQQQRQLMSKLHAELKRLQLLQAQTANAQHKLELQQQRRVLLQQLGAIERQLRTANAGPRRRWLGPSARGTAFALYDDRMRTRIERQGTLNFPQQDGRRLYGQLVMQIMVDASGRLLQTTVLRSSGQPRLDLLACAIVAQSQPFGAFDAKMRAQAEQLVLVAGFDFSRSDGLQTHLQSPP